jgi:hypothetical protein
MHLPIIRRSQAHVRTGLIVLSCCLHAPMDAAAQAHMRHHGQPPERAQPLVVSIGGGVSLGAYQAGLGWALLELYRATNSNPALARELGVPLLGLATLAGTSAGTINALLWALEACKVAAPAPPESSLFWRIWTPVGLRQLLQDDVPRPQRDRALFDRTFFRDSIYPQLYEHARLQALDSGCSVGLGTPLTRLQPDTLRIGELSIVTQRMATAVSVRVRTVDDAARLLFFWPDSTVYAQPRLGRLILPPRSGTTGEVDFARVLDAVEASSTFPVAFQPVLLDFVDPSTGARSRGQFMDGGVFDNSPIGLALDLLISSPEFAPRLKDDRADTVSLVLVSPVRLRGPLQRARAAEPREYAGAGLLAAMQLMQGALPTARQYEMQLWARDRPISQLDTLLVRMTSRAHPVIGEHLGLFAAFLARPFREHDFFVGAYDALDFVVREHACVEPAGRDMCVARHMARLIAQPVIDFGPAAPPLLAALYAQEYAADEHAAWRRDVQDASLAPGDGHDAARAKLMLGVFEALQAQYAVRRDACALRVLPEFILCQNGFRDVLAALGSSPTMRAAVGDWQQHCDASHGAASGECNDASELARLLRNPDRYGAEMLDRMFSRVRDVEHQIHMDRRTAHVGDDGVRGRQDAELLAEVLTAVYRSRPTRPRYGFVWSPGSAPDKAWAAHALLPYHVAANLGTAGVEAGIRPTWYIDRKTGITFPATLMLARTDLGDGHGRRLHGYAGAGAGLALGGVLPAAAELFLFPEIGASLQHVGRISALDERGWVSEAYIDVSLLVGRLRLAIRHSTEPGIFGGSNWSLAAGIADFSGLLYWAGHFMRQK